MKEDINVEDDEYDDDWKSNQGEKASWSGGDSSGGVGDTGHGSDCGHSEQTSFQDNLPQYDWSNPATFDPALVSTISEIQCWLFNY